MNPEVARQTETARQPEVDAVNTRRTELLARYPNGPEADIAHYREWLRTELTYTSNAIEGSTLTDIETRMVLEDDAVIPNRSLREHLEARDHAIAWDYATDVLERKPKLDTDDLLSLHQRVLYSTNNSEGGVFRRTGTRIAGSQTVFPNALKVPSLIDRLVEDINNRPEDMHPVLRAALVHLDFVKIHPFVDGNGRTARILMNTLLRRTGFVAIPIYPKDRLEYLNAIEQADQDEGAVFCALMLRLERETLDQLLQV